MTQTTINVFGGNGFIGSRYCELTPNIIKNDRDDYKIKTNEVVYFISTRHNNNILSNPYIDIESNLITLIKVLESEKNNSNLIFNYISTRNCWLLHGRVHIISYRPV